MLEVREIHDPVEQVARIRAADAVQGGADLDILAAAEQRIEPRAELDQGLDAAPDTHLAGVGLEQPVQNLQQRALARAVMADNGHRLPLFQLEGDVVERPELAGPQPRRAGGQELTQDIADAIGEGTPGPIAIFFRQAGYRQDGIAHRAIAAQPRRAIKCRRATRYRSQPKTRAMPVAAMTAKGLWQISLDVTSDRVAWSTGVTGLNGRIAFAGAG